MQVIYDWYCRINKYEQCSVFTAQYCTSALDLSIYTTSVYVHIMSNSRFEISVSIWSRLLRNQYWQFRHFRQFGNGVSQLHVIFRMPISSLLSWVFCKFQSLGLKRNSDKIIFQPKGIMITFQQNWRSVSHYLLVHCIMQPTFLKYNHIAEGWCHSIRQHHTHPISRQK